MKKSTAAATLLILAMTVPSCTTDQLLTSAQGVGEIGAISAEWKQQHEDIDHGVAPPPSDAGPAITPTGQAINSPLFDSNGRYLGIQQDGSIPD